MIRSFPHSGRLRPVAFSNSVAQDFPHQGNEGNEENFYVSTSFLSLPSLSSVQLLLLFPRMAKDSSHQGNEGNEETVRAPGSVSLIPLPHRFILPAARASCPRSYISSLSSVGFPPLFPSRVRLRQSQGRGGTRSLPGVLVALVLIRGFRSLQSPGAFPSPSIPLPARFVGNRTDAPGGRGYVQSCSEAVRESLYSCAFVCIRGFPFPRFPFGGCILAENLRASVFICGFHWPSFKLTQQPCKTIHNLFPYRRKCSGPAGS
jgi:hypothetical protein